MSFRSKQDIKFWIPGTQAPGLKEDKIEQSDSVGFIAPYNPAHSLAIALQRQKLPIFKNRGHILYLIEQYRVLIIVGETGCGKSTQIPQFLMEAGWGGDGVIGVTLPRQVAAITIATRVAEEKGVTVGCEVGYSVRFDNSTDPKLTKIKFLTDGMLIQELMMDPLLLNYSIIMVDEAHERSIHTDMIIALLKKIMKKRSDLRVIVSSATLDAEAIRDFFNTKDLKDKGDDIAVCLSIEGRVFPVDIYYINNPIPDYIQGVVDTVQKIHKQEMQGDILAFLPGMDDVDRAVKLVREHENERPSGGRFKLMVLPMYAGLTMKEQMKVFQRAPERTRKAIIATNIAETSITINGIGYVVDSGFVKQREFNPYTGIERLLTVPVSQASAKQRAGRAGRVRDGKAYRLYPEEEYDKLPESNTPELQRSNLGTILLRLMALGVSDLLHFPFLSKPPTLNLATSLDILYALGAVDDKGQLTDPLGTRMSEFPLEPMFAKMLLVSGEFECSEEILTIAAMLNIQNVFVTPPGGRAKSERAKYKFSVKEGDLLTLLNVYSSFVKKKKSARWCRENYLNFTGLMRAVEIRRQLKGLLEKFQVPLISCEGDVDRLCRCITAGFFPNAARLHYTGEYRSLKDDMTLYIHPTFVLSGQDQPDCVVFNDVVITSREYMRDITVIEASWLYELAPHYYKYGTERELAAAKRMKTS